MSEFIDNFITGFIWGFCIISIYEMFPFTSSNVEILKLSNVNLELCKQNLELKRQILKQDYDNLKSQL